MTEFLAIALPALTIFLLRITDVSLGTIRMILSIQGRRYVAAAIGFIEVTVFIIAIGKVMSQLDNFVNVLAYSGGFAGGTILGITIESRLAMGYRVVRVITHRANDRLVSRLRDSAFGVTKLTGEGRDGMVYILLSVVRRKNLRRFTDIVDELAPRAFVTVEESREHARGYLLDIYSKMK